VVTLSLVTIACALVSRQFRIMHERAYATRLEALCLTDHLADGSDRLPKRTPRGHRCTGFSFRVRPHPVWHHYCSNH
jgi:hypothetical protein